MDRNRSLRARLDDTGAHSTVVDDLIATDRFVAILAEDARLTGTHSPERSYRAEAEQLAPAALLWMLEPPSEREIATAAAIAALHAA